MPLFPIEQSTNTHENLLKSSITIDFYQYTEIPIVGQHVPETLLLDLQPTFQYLWLIILALRERNATCLTCYRVSSQIAQGTVTGVADFSRTKWIAEAVDCATNGTDTAGRQAGDDDRVRHSEEDNSREPPSHLLNEPIERLSLFQCSREAVQYEAIFAFVPPQPTKDQLVDEMIGG